MLYIQQSLNRHIWLPREWLVQDGLRAFSTAVTADEGTVKMVFVERLRSRYSSAKISSRVSI